MFSLNLLNVNFMESFSSGIEHVYRSEKISRYFLSGLLTKKFINLIKHAEDGILDLNKAADTLEVIYIINTLFVFGLS